MKVLMLKSEGFFTQLLRWQFDVGEEIPGSLAQIESKNVSRN